MLPDDLEVLTDKKLLQLAQQMGITPVDKPPREELMRRLRELTY